MTKNDSPIENTITEIKPMVSVIVPVYNAENGLEECVDSVIKQTWENLEIILIDDGSSDKSSIICDRLCEKDARVSVIHQINRGVSYARNVGLIRAHGEYVVFVDSDDKLTIDSVQIRMMGIVDSDLVVAGYDVVDSNDKKLYEMNKYETKRLTQIEMLMLMFGEHTCGYQGYLWNKLFKMEIIRNYSLKFQEDIHYNEDRLFVVEYLMKAKKVVIESTTVYFYKINPKGVMESAKRFSREVYNKWITEFDAYRVMSRELRECDLMIYNMCNMDAMRSAINHREMVPSTYKDEIQYFSDRIREFSRPCIADRNITLGMRIKVIGHYILGR